MKKKIFVWLFGIAIIFFGWTGSAAWAQQEVDTWDVKVNGNVIGSGYLAFWDDSTLTGYLIIKPNLNLTKKMTPERFIVGFFEIKGRWETSGENRRTGFFVGSPDENCGPADKDDLEATSFSGTVKTGKSNSRLNMVSKTNNGPMQLTGVPPSDRLSDFDGTSWTAKVQLTDKVAKRTDTFVEFYTLTTSVLDYPNLYDLSGVGPNYSLRGCVSFSSWDRVALEIAEIAEDDGATTRYVVGRFKSDSEKASVSGSDSEKAVIFMTIINTTP